MRYLAVLYDMDGTVLDTLEDLKNAASAAMRAFGRPPLTLEQTRRYVGNGSRRLIEQALGEKGIETASAEVTMVPDTTVKLEGKDAEKMMNLVDALEEHDDVQNIYANYEIEE